MAFSRTEGSGPEKSKLKSKVIQQENTVFHLQKFKLFETFSNYYLIGRDKTRTFWKVLKIDRLDQYELSIHEDQTIYSENECIDLLSRIKEGNKSTGGLNLVATCYGIVGFVKFTGPHYMLLITKRKKIGSICGHAIYKIEESKMVMIPNAATVHSQTENRYKKLLSAMDLTKDFYFSYSYNLMLGLQKNISNHAALPPLYETLFVWNEFLTRGIRNELKNTLWTVALIYGFFKQVKLMVAGRGFILTLIARRSRHYAGTRYLKRGVNKSGRVANDVETEQIVSEDVPNGSLTQITSAVQIRGSIPLFWSQDMSVINYKPDIILLKDDINYAATKRHFKNLVIRYGSPIIILNLIKGSEKKRRESILLEEFAHAIDNINKELTEENQLKFLHWDLSHNLKDKRKNVLDSLIKVAGNAITMNGFFYGHMIPYSRTEEWLSATHLQDNSGDPAENASQRKSSKQIGEIYRGIQLDISQYCKPLMFQQGVMRTNCIDCLDRTNVAQFCHGLVSLGNQLYALEFTDRPKVDLGSPLADELIKIYEAMGDALALQYGGSAAHNKIFADRRGQPKAVTQTQKFYRSFQRYYNNAVMDPEKQNAIDVFLGHLQPQLDSPDFFYLENDQHYDFQGLGLDPVINSPISSLTRSRSDGDIPAGYISEEIEVGCIPFTYNVESSKNVISKPKSKISTFESGGSYGSYPPSMPPTMLRIGENGSDDTSLHEHESSFCHSNFLGDDWLCSSGNSWGEFPFDRSVLMRSSTGLSSTTIASGMKDYGSSPFFMSGSSIGKESNPLTEVSETFMQ